MIAAILRAHVLSMRIAANRGRVFSLITGIVWYGMWIGVAAGCGLYLSAADINSLRSDLPLGFLLVCFYWQLMPVMTANLGSGLDLRKLLIYPIPRPKLFQVEAMLRLTSNLEMVFVLAAGSVGLLANPSVGAWTKAPGLLAGTALFLAFNLFLGSAVRSLMERLMSKRKAREIVVLCIVMVWMLPRVLLDTSVGMRSMHRFAAIAEVVGMPWSAAAHAALGVSVGVALISLACWMLGAIWFAGRQFDRSLRHDAVAAQAAPDNTVSGAHLWKERFYRLPSLFLRDPLAGIVEKELRSLARTPRFRMVFIMGFTFGLMVWFPMMAGRHRSGAVSRYFLVTVSLYALSLLGQVTYWNCFGFDRSATAFYFASPQPLSRVLAGKNIASLFFIYLELIIVAGVTSLLRLSAGWGNVVETLVVVAVCSLYMLAMGNISSVQYPRGLSPERSTQGGASGRFQGLIFLLYPVALLPVFLAYMARYALNSELAFVLVLALAAVIGGTLYWIAMESAVATAHKRREAILQELSQGEGPVASA